MDEWGRRDSPGERIEVELTTFEPRTRKAAAPTTPHRQHDPTQGEQPGNDAPADDAVVSRRMLVLTVLGVGVVALVLGWAVGRGGDGDTAEDVRPTPTTDAVTTTERITDTIPPPATTARPRPSTTTTTTIASGTPALIVLPPELRTLPYELAIISERGDIARIDFAEGTMREYEGDGQPNWIAFAPGGDLMVFGGYDNASLRYVQLDGLRINGPELSEMSMFSQVIVDGASTVWQVNDDQATAIAGVRNGETLQIPETSAYRGGVTADPAGGLLFFEAGDLYQLGGPNDLSRLTGGEVIAIGRDAAVVYECDEFYECAYFTIDRASGSRASLPLQELVRNAPAFFDQQLVGRLPEDDERILIEPGGLWSSQPSIVGTTAVIRISALSNAGFFGSGVAIIDLVSQQLVGVIDGSYNGATITDDGAWVFARNQVQGLTAFDVANAATYTIGGRANAHYYSIVVRTK
ncbi:MAG TPA: hypothetical protein VMM60_11335 [Ilumatobacter sp.]|nr:hypothetical protein [Ilumatobacter sp.]